MANGDRTGVRIDYSDEQMNPNDWNNLVKYVDNAIGRVLTQYMMADGLLTAETNPLLLNTTTKRFTAPTGAAVVAGLIRGRAFYLDTTHESSGIVSAAGTTYIEDNSLINSQGFWINAYVIFTSGTYSGQIRKVTGFASTSSRLTWTTPLAGAPSAGDTFVVTFYYISGLTNGALNYIYGVVGSRTPNDQIIEWAANTTGIAPASSMLMATMTLDAGGTVTASDNNPTGAARVSYIGIGAHDVITLTGSITGLAASGSTQITRSHDYLLYRGGIRYSLSDANCTLVVDECWEPDSITFTVTNAASYSLDLTYVISVEGWRRRYFSV